MFITADESATDQEAIQRLEIASSYKINAMADNVEIQGKSDCKRWTRGEER